MTTAGTICTRYLYQRVKKLRLRSKLTASHTHTHTHTHTNTQTHTEVQTHAQAQAQAQAQAHAHRHRHTLKRERLLRCVMMQRSAPEATAPHAVSTTPCRPRGACRRRRGVLRGRAAPFALSLLLSPPLTQSEVSVVKDSRHGLLRIYAQQALIGDRVGKACRSLPQILSVSTLISSGITSLPGTWHRQTLEPHVLPLGARGARRCRRRSTRLPRARGSGRSGSRPPF
jgi:hypothetical protein